MKQQGDALPPSANDAPAPQTCYVYETSAQQLYMAAEIYRSVKLLRLIRLRRRQQEFDHSKNIGTLPNEIFQLILEHVADNCRERAKRVGPAAHRCSCGRAFRLYGSSDRLRESEAFQNWAYEKGELCECTSELMTGLVDPDYDPLSHCCSLAEEFYDSKEGQEYLLEMELEGFYDCAECDDAFSEIWCLAAHPDIHCAQPSRTFAADHSAAQEVLEEVQDDTRDLLQAFGLERVNYLECQCELRPFDDAYRQCRETRVYLAATTEDSSGDLSKVITRS